MIPTDLSAAEIEAKEAHLRLAREDINTFCEYIGLDDETQEPIVQSPIHEKFQLLADAFDRFILWAHPESGKTNQLAIYRTIWELGHNPNLRFVILCKTQAKAIDTVNAIRKHITENERVHEVFPNLVPGSKWEEDKIIVKRSSQAKDASVQAMGLFGAVTGKRIDRLITDDMLDAENTLSVESRERVAKWFQKTVLDRLTRESKVINMTNAWHPKDVLHVMEREHGWKGFRFPVVDAEGEPTWPLKWDKDRLAQKREEMGPLEFARAFLNKPRDDGESPFDEQAIKKCIERGDDYDVIYELSESELPEGSIIVHGVDLAVSKKESSAKTVITSVLYWPEDETRQLLWVSGGRWSASEIKAQLISTFDRYGGIFVVENNAAQDWIIQITHETHAIPIVPFTTGRNKSHPEFGVEGLAAEIHALKWILPVRGPCKKDVEMLIENMTYYTRGTHTGDFLMSAWFAREGIRKLVSSNRVKRKGNVRFVDFG